MNTDELEQVAFSKTYNDKMPDELISSQEEKGDTSVYFSKVMDILSKHNMAEKQEKLWANDFSYLKIKEDAWMWHFLKIMDGKYGMVLDSDYILDYSSCLANSELFGIFNFRKGKEFSLEYRKVSMEDFQTQMKELADVFPLVEQFETERNQIFYEYDGDAIYCYQEGYVWKLSGYSRNIINEYMQMYALLMSFTSLKEGKYADNFVLKYIYLLEKHALQYLYKGIDLRKESALSLCEKYQDFLDVVTVSIDNFRYYEIFDLDYYIAKRKKSYAKTEYIPLSIINKEDWFFQGTFSLGVLGDYTTGALEFFTEIFKSVELKISEKKELLLKIVEEKEQECLEKKDYIKDQLFFSYFKNCFVNPKFYFHQDRWIDFLKVEKLSLQEVTVEALELWMEEQMRILSLITPESIYDSEEWKKFVGYIDPLAFQAKIRSSYLTITPMFLVVECEMFHQRKTYIITENYELVEWNSQHF